MTGTCTSSHFLVFDVIIIIKHTDHFMKKKLSKPSTFMHFELEYPGEMPISFRAYWMLNVAFVGVYICTTKKKNIIRRRQKALLLRGEQIITEKWIEDSPTRLFLRSFVVPRGHELLMSGGLRREERRGGGGKRRLKPMVSATACWLYQSCIIIRDGRGSSSYCSFQHFLVEWVWTQYAGPGML